MFKTLSTKQTLSVAQNAKDFVFFLEGEVGLFHYGKDISDSSSSL